MPLWSRGDRRGFGEQVVGVDLSRLHAAVVFGEHKPGQPELPAWRDLLGELPPDHESKD